ncbi:MAG: DUF3313 family protein [Gammaproteobacteria bacterium]|nr:DUF3313 family protein [Gammaproteobacteria bacterium]
MNRIPDVDIQAPGSSFRRGAVALLCGLWLAALPAALAAPGDARLKRTEAEWSHDGLRRAEIRGLDLVYLREGASLAGYRQVWLKSVEVAFRRDWPGATRPGSRIAASELANIKSGLAKILREETARELGRGGYALVEGPGEDVLEVDVSIMDLYINAPDVPTAARVQRYTLSVGEMTLVAELRDAPSGELVARVLDRREGRDRGRLELTTSVDNVAAARTAARDWARILRRQLDAARGIAPS